MSRGRSWLVAGATALGACMLMGCAPNVAFSRVPSREEVRAKTPEQLMAQYPDFEEFRPRLGRRLFLTVFDMPDVQPLIGAWGEPNAKRLSWWNLMPGTLVPPFHPISVCKWHIDGKTVVADLDSALALGYKPHVWTIAIRESQK